MLQRSNWTDLSGFERVNFEEVCEVLANGGRHNSSRSTPENLSTAFKSNRGVAKICNGQIIAIAMLWTTADSETLEIGTVWVHADFRGHGLLTLVLDELLEKAGNSKLFFFTKDDDGSVALIRWAIKKGFVIVRSSQEHPHTLRWASQVGVVCRLPSSIYGFTDLNNRILVTRTH